MGSIMTFYKLERKGSSSSLQVPFLKYFRRKGEANEQTFKEKRSTTMKHPRREYLKTLHLDKKVMGWIMFIRLPPKWRVFKLSSSSLDASLWLISSAWMFTHLLVLCSLRIWGKNLQSFQGCKPVSLHTKDEMWRRQGWIRRSEIASSFLLSLADLLYRETEKKFHHLL